MTSTLITIVSLWFIFGHFKNKGDTWKRNSNWNKAKTNIVWFNFYVELKITIKRISACKGLWSGVMDEDSIQKMQTSLGLEQWRKQ